MKKYIYCLFLVLSAFSTSAQTSFSISPTDTVFAAKPATFMVFYNYIQFDNLSGDSLFMRWEIIDRHIENTTVAMGEWGNWVTAYQDPSNSSQMANNILTNDFILVPESGAFDKLIYQLLPHDEIGLLITTFKIYPINDPGDFTIVTFHYSALEEPSSADDLAVLNNDLSVFPIPASSSLSVQNNSKESIDIRIFNELGQAQMTLAIDAKRTTHLTCGDWQRGIYFMQYVIDNTVFVKKVLVK